MKDKAINIQLDDTIRKLITLLINEYYYLIYTRDTITVNKIFGVNIHGDLLIQVINNNETYYDTIPLSDHSEIELYKCHKMLIAVTEILDIVLMDKYEACNLGKRI